MTVKPRIALFIGSTRPTRCADKLAYGMLKQAQARVDRDVAPIEESLIPLVSAALDALVWSATASVAARAMPN